MTSAVDAHVHGQRLGNCFQAGDKKVLGADVEILSIAMSMMKEVMSVHHLQTRV